MLTPSTTYAGRPEAALETLHIVVHMEAAAVERGLPPAQCNPILAAAAAFLRLGLPALSLSALGHAQAMVLTSASLEQKVCGNEDCIRMCGGDGRRFVATRDVKHLEEGWMGKRGLGLVWGRVSHFIPQLPPPPRVTIPCAGAPPPGRVPQLPRRS